MQHHRGITLVELLLSLTILLIITILTAPPLIQFSQSVQSRQAGRALFGTLNYARAVAISQRVTISVCPSSDQAICGDDWSAGGIVFKDINKDGTRDSTEHILRTLPDIPTNASLQRFPQNRKFVRFRPNGRLSFPGNFSFCPPDREASEGWVIVVNRLGRIYYGNDNNQNGIPENGSGIDLACPA